jgi:hypothetical protein
VVSRVLAAVLGGYGLAALATVFLSAALPMAMAGAVLSATMLGFLVYTAAVVWVFAAGSAGQAWRGILVCGGLLGGGWLAFAAL